MKPFTNQILAGPPTVEELVQLLAEAGTEIANLDAPDNVVCQRLREMRERLEREQEA